MDVYVSHPREDRDVVIVLVFDEAQNKNLGPAVDLVLTTDTEVQFMTIRVNKRTVDHERRP